MNYFGALPRHRGLKLNPVCGYHRENHREHERTHQIAALLKFKILLSLSSSFFLVSLGRKKGNYERRRTKTAATQASASTLVRARYFVAQVQVFLNFSVRRTSLHVEILFRILLTPCRKFAAAIVYGQRAWLWHLLRPHCMKGCDEIQNAYELIARNLQSMIL